MTPPRKKSSEFHQVVCPSQQNDVCTMYRWVRCLYFWYEFVPATMAAVVGRTQQTNKNRGDVRLPIVSRTACILIFIMIPSAGGDIVLRAPALGPIMVASTTHNSGLWVEAGYPTLKYVGYVPANWQGSHKSPSTMVRRARRGGIGAIGSGMARFFHPGERIRER